MVVLDAVLWHKVYRFCTGNGEWYIVANVFYGNNFSEECPGERREMQL